MSEVSTVHKEALVKKIFQLKYIVPFVLIQGVLSLLVSLISSVHGQVGGFGLIMFIVIYFFSKKVSTNEEKTIVSSHQGISFFMYLVVSAAILVAIFLLNSGSTASQKRTSSALSVDTLVANLQKILPIEVNEEHVIFKVEKIDKQSLVMHVRTANYTREEELALFHGNEEEVKASYLKDELRDSCSQLRRILSSGIKIYATYYGKMNQSITQIYLNDRRCRMYYSKKG